jgi:tetratricopeptide (TPR) repeat protein
MKTFYWIGFCALTVTFVLGLSLTFGSCVSGGAASAEEYYSIGMAYFELGKYEEAERWLSRARAKNKTLNASEYNLGRIAFETGRYTEAVNYFESILKRDPDNVLALKAAAYTCIRNDEIGKAEMHYNRLLTLVPESADDGYNYALVLFAMKKYPEAEQVLKNHEFALLDNNDVLLLYARTQKEQGKVEAIDTYASWLANNNDAKVRYEYAQLLESHEFYARALDEYQLTLTSLNNNSVNPTKRELRFTTARLFLIADGDNPQGLNELKGAVDDGFDDFDAMEELLNDDRISTANKDSIRTVITEAKRAAEAAKAAEQVSETAETEESDDEELEQ